MDLILVPVNPEEIERTLNVKYCVNRYLNYTFNDCDNCALPDSHALLNVSWSHLVAEVHHKLGKLFDIDDVFGVFRICIDDLCASI